MTSGTTESNRPAVTGPLSGSAGNARAIASRDRGRGNFAGRRTGRLPTVALLLAGLVVSSITREWAVRLQADAARTGPYAPSTATGGSGGPSLGSMDSFFLALLLGGLRGPLVMFLWASSESQKNERDLEDFDTKVEMIRLLQPEFDSVHLFQIWNKAYNISAQLASLPRKYSAILDALAYAKKVDAARRANININMAINQLYSNKLGGAVNDKAFYIRQVRADTRHRAGPVVAPRAGVPPQRHDVLLDEQGNLLSGLLVPNRERPGDLEAHVLVPKQHLPAFEQAAAAAGVSVSHDSVMTADNGDQLVKLPESQAKRLEATFKPDGVRYDYTEWNDGSELQYLKPYQPFPEGISPLALGYNYAKRAQVLWTVGKQKPAQLSGQVVDRQPGLELKQWSEEEWERGCRGELEAFGKPVPKERSAMQLPTAELSLDVAPAAPDRIDSALRGYRTAVRLSHDARAEYARHLARPENFATRFQEYGSHVDTLGAEIHLASGDHDFLRARTLPAGPERDGLFRAAAGHYDKAVSAYRYLDLRYYVPIEVLNPLLPAGKTRLDLERLRDEDPRSLDAIYAGVSGKLTDKMDANLGDRIEYLPYQQRALLRLRQLATLLGPATVPQREAVEAERPATRPTQPATGAQ